VKRSRLRQLVLLIASLDLHIAIAVAFATRPTTKNKEVSQAIEVSLSEVPQEIQKPKPQTQLQEKEVRKTTGIQTPQPQEVTTKKSPAAEAAPLLATEQEGPLFLVADRQRFPGGVTATSGMATSYRSTGYADGVLGGNDDLFGGRSGGALFFEAHPAERNWHCPWPRGAHGLATAPTRVHVIAHVNLLGRATRIDVLDAQTTGLGFEEAARTCALEQRYRPARLGQEAVDGRTGRFAVIFYEE
jgi:hypothetical protein